MKIINGDSLEVLKRATENSVDAIVTDPPYGLSFMGKKWDYDVPSKELWVEALRVLKPGGHLLSFAGSRTYHRMAVNIEDAGFEIRDQIMWVYGSGFPKSHNIGKAVDKLQGNEREITGTQMRSDGRAFAEGSSGFAKGEITLTKGNSQYEGWGTALKPAHEPIVVARKPLSENTIAKNVLEWGTGGINIDECRVGTEGGTAKGTFPNEDSNGIYGNGLNGSCEIKDIGLGRFPANFIHDGSDEVVGLFPDSKTGAIKPYITTHEPKDTVASFSKGMGKGNLRDFTQKASSGSAARFFYCAKASKKDRNEGLEEFEEKQYSHDGRDKEIENAYQRNKSVSKNNHPTVKPTQLMQYLVRLVTPKGGTVLDPFMGSGSTGKACKLEGFDFIGIDLDPEYCKIAQARIDNIKL